MSSSEFQKRWQSEDYKNYLKVIEALLYLRDGLGPFSNHVISEFQSEILRKHNIAPKQCTCKAKHVKKEKQQPEKLVPECSGVCSVLFMDILMAHRGCKNPSLVYWDNSKINRWSVDAWEIAKIYMGRGQKADNIGPQKSDSAALLQLLINCKRFWSYTPSKDVDEVIGKRNAAMHSSTLSFTNVQMQEAIKIMVDFLKKILQTLSAEKDIESIKKEIEKNISILQELMKTEFEIFLKNHEKSPHEAETKIFEEIIKDHENRLNSLEELTEKVEEIKVVIPLLEMMQRNPDLMAKLEDGYQNLISLSQLEERTSALMDMTKGTASRVTDIEEDVADLRNKVKALESKCPDKSRSHVTNYKGQLKNFLDSKKIIVPPTYNKRTDPMMNNKWLASVTVILGSETKTFQSPDSCNKIIDAEHSAALEAYQFLTQHEELFSASDELVTGADPREELDKMLESFGFSKATYNDCKEKFTGSVKNFTASVTMNVTGIIQKKVDDVNMKQPDRLQAVAVEALKAIGQEVANSAKNILYGWCGKNGYTTPKYYPESPVEAMSYIHVISSAFGEKHKVEVVGSWHPNKKDAKRSAAELLLRIITETRVMDIWSSSRQSLGTSASTAATKPSQSSDTQCSKAKTEAKASETIKAMPTMLDSSSYCDELKSLCEKLNMNPPEYKVVPTKENQFQANVTMDFVFGPGDDEQFTNKAEAENEAAHIALAVVKTDKTSEMEKKKFKSLLNEFCQQQGIKNNAPKYITTGSGTNFHSNVQFKFVESCSEVFQTESEACNFSAKKVLLKLGQGKNHFEILKKYCAKFGLEEPEVEYKSNPDGVEAFQAVLDGTCTFVLEIPSEGKKDAESQSSDTQYSKAKAEAKASEIIKVMPTMLDSSSYCDELKTLCEKLNLNPPEYKVVPTKENQFQANVTMDFVFGPGDDKQFTNKAEAENEAAHIALAVLKADKTSEMEKTKFKSLLNEFCQQQGIKNNAPKYITTGSGTNFHSNVQVKFVESCSEVFQTESEACNFSAKKVLLKLGQGTNHFEILKKYCAEFGLEEPKVEYKSNPDGVDTFRAVLDGTCIFVSEIPSHGKKDAEKNAACQALKVLYPGGNYSDLNKCKNLLQEKTPSVLPKYDIEKLQNGQFTGKVTISFRMEGSSWHSNKEDALNEVAKEFLTKSTSSSG